MSHWNYRVLRRNGYVGIYDTYYDNNNVPNAMSENPCSPEADDIGELREALRMMERALDVEILDYDSIGSVKS